MTDKHDKLVEMALKSGAVNHFVQGLPDRYAFSLNELTAFAAAHVASLCADVEPVAIYHGRCVIDCGEHGHLDMQLLKLIPAGSNLYPASTVAFLTAQRDAALSRVAELEKDAQDRLDTVQAIFDAIGYTKEYAMQWPKEKASVTFKRWFDEQMRAALTKGQPAQHPQQEQSK